ncbi:MAG: hypothetical protein ACK2UW_19675 [Anaerolineales bacterium]|jgi:hypothetical protein
MNRELIIGDLVQPGSVDQEVDPNPNPAGPARWAGTMPRLLQTPLSRFRAVENFGGAQ